MNTRTVTFTGPPVPVVYERCIEDCDHVNAIIRRMHQADEEGVYPGSFQADAEALRGVVATLISAAGYLNADNFPEDFAKT